MELTLGICLFTEMTAMGKTLKKDKSGGNFSKNKKSKLTKGEKKEFKPPNKRGRLVLRNLPFKVSFNKFKNSPYKYHNIG